MMIWCILYDAATLKFFVFVHTHTNRIVHISIIKWYWTQNRIISYIHTPNFIPGLLVISIYHYCCRFWLKNILLATRNYFNHSYVYIDARINYVISLMKTKTKISFLEREDRVHRFIIVWICFCLGTRRQKISL